MGGSAIAPRDRAAVLAFQRETGELLRAVTGTQRVATAAMDAFTALYPNMRQLIETDLPALEGRLEDAGVPWTTGRALPAWPPNG